MRHYLLICLLLLGTSAHGGLVKWVDANGKVHYSDAPPPPNVQAQKLNIPSSAPDAGSGVSATKTSAEREADYRKAQQARDEADKKAAKQAEQAQAKQKYCKEARSQLATLQNSPNLVTYNANGERNYMDDVARQQKIADVRKGISENCSD